VGDNYKIQKGGNYGWSVMEGHARLRPRSAKKGPTPILRRSSNIRTPISVQSLAVLCTAGKRLKDLKALHYGDLTPAGVLDIPRDASPKDVRVKDDEGPNPTSRRCLALSANELARPLHAL